MTVVLLAAVAVAAAGTSVLWLGGRTRGRHAPSAGRRPNAHAGAVEGWSPMRELLSVAVPETDPRVLLDDARAAHERAESNLHAALAAVDAWQQRQDREALTNMQTAVTGALRRVGHLEIDTCEIERTTYMRSPR